MNLDLDTACAEWLEAKNAEKEAIERRRLVEDHISNLLGVPETLDGTETTTTDGGHKIKVVGRLNRKVDAEQIQEIAAEYGIENSLHTLFRWKPEINMKAWKAASPSITKPLLGGIVTTPGRASFTIEKGE